MYNERLNAMICGTDTYRGTDGVTTNLYNDAVFKVYDGIKLKVLSDGEVSAKLLVFAPDGWFKKGSNWSSLVLDKYWIPLFDSARLNGGKECDGCE